MIAEQKEEEDNIAALIGQSKSGSCSPMIRKSSSKNRDSVNNSILQRSSAKHKYKAKNTPSVPMPHFMPDYDFRFRDQEHIEKIPDVMRENSHSDSAEEELPYSNKFKRKLSNNGKSTQDKGRIKVSLTKNKRGSRFNDIYLNSNGASIKTRDDNNHSISKKISKHLQSNQHVGKPGFTSTGANFSLEKHGSNSNQYDYEIPANQ